MLFLVSWLALAGNPYEGKSADVAAEGTVSAAPDRVFEVLKSARNLPGAFPADCAVNWDVDPAVDGLGAKYTVQYRAASMRRKLKGMVSRVEARQDGAYFVELDHQGAKGFVTRLKLSPDGAGTRVEMTTFLNQPPWPFRKVYFEKVLPAWQDCHRRTVEAIDGLVIAR